MIQIQLLRHQRAFWFWQDCQPETRLRQCVYCTAFVLWRHPEKAMSRFLAAQPTSDPLGTGGDGMVCWNLCQQGAQLLIEIINHCGGIRIFRRGAVGTGELKDGAIPRFMHKCKNGVQGWRGG